MKVTVENFKAYSKNTLRGFFDLNMQGLMTIVGCTVHCKNDSWWIGMPAKPYEDKDGTTKWQQVIDMPKERLQSLRDLVMPDLRAELGESKDNSKPLNTFGDDDCLGDDQPSRKSESKAEVAKRMAGDWQPPDDDIGSGIPF